MFKQFQFGTPTPMSLPAKIASIVFGLVLFLPILALLVVAGVLAAFVFAILLLVGVVRTKTRSLFGGAPSAGPSAKGRKNVRVKQDSDAQNSQPPRTPKF